MEDFIKLQEKQENEYLVQSVNTGLYAMNDIQTKTESVYPWAPTIRLQKSGGSLLQGKELVDVDSELMNLNRKFSKDPNHHYKPDENMVMTYTHFDDGFFHQEDTKINDPPELLKGQTKNRWVNVYLNPQENVIEPFETRLGTNTYLDLMDKEDDCKQPIPN